MRPSGHHRLFRRLALLLAPAALLVPTTLLPPTAANADVPAGPPPSARYLALGDSYAAGEGLPPYESGTDTATNSCHRSAGQSYPVLLQATGRPGFSGLTSVACSGAGTAHLVAAVPGAAEPPQLSALGPATRTVTLTIGGNDAGFGVVLGDCVYSPVPDVQRLLSGARNCRLRDDVAVSTRIAALAGGQGAPTVPGVVPIPVLLQQIHARAPHAIVLITGYPRLFGTRVTDPAGCRVNGALPLYVAERDTRWIRRKASALNAALRSAAEDARLAGMDVRYADVAREFRGHELCDRRAPWLNGVLLLPGTVPQLSPASFHPTARGQQAYADAVLRAARPLCDHLRCT